MLAALGLAVALAAFVLVSRQRAPGTDAPVTDAIPADPQKAYERAIELTRAGRPEEAIRYYRSVIAVRPQVWQVRSDHASALLNSAGESRVHRGLAGPRLRSSVERVERMKTALAESDRAEALTDTPAGRAYVKALRAQALANWGLAWNAIVEYGRATELDPNAKAARADGFTLMAIMRQGAGEKPLR